MVDKQTRLAEFFRRLDQAPAATTAAEAFSLVAETMYAVEDEMTDIPRRDPPPGPLGPSDGRMYPPSIHSKLTRRNLDGSIRAFRGLHWVDYGADGSITITHAESGHVEFAKAGG